ncbi:hypothetical protein DFH29DRAFT_526748 [Suillus ampliporus]|nr:hypothetical protein DFH29DRAFT_526748 [Suillus ampliporus]
MAHAGQIHHKFVTSPKTAEIVAHGEPEEQKDEPAEKSRPYSIYTRPEKWLIVVIASLAALFSPLTANVYFPAIPTIAAAFHKSIESINLSVTVYMVFQGLLCSGEPWQTALGDVPFFLHVSLYYVYLASAWL